MTTLAELVTKTTRRLSMVSGQGIQLFAEDRIVDMIQHKFDILFDEVFWPQFTAFYVWTLDEATGRVTNDISAILKRYDDIGIMFQDTTNRKITPLPSQINPNSITGTTPRHFTSNSTRIFNIWPLASTGDITIRVRTKPDDFTDTDEIPFDNQALILGTVYDYLEDDGTNPAATQKFEQLFENRVRQLKNNIMHDISLDPYDTQTNTEWT